MSGIVCAIRGGPRSATTVKTAVELAILKRSDLHLLYVVNLDFLERTSDSRAKLASKELTEMGEFILLTAYQTAKREGVDSLQIIRQGDVRTEITKYCKEIGANFLVIGKPAFHQEGSHFDEVQLEEFILQMEKETGTDVVIAGENEGEV